MDKEALRKQLYEEIASQFEAKLKEAKRQKSQLEEEIELSSEKWRTERRRLNAEIDRLEAALGEARQTGRKTPGTKTGRSVDPQELAKIQAVADEKVKKAARDWEAERAKLQAEVSRLQSGIAELIERSNNPLRSTQLEREKVELKYDEALRAKRQAESVLLAAKTEWEEEKVKLMGEVMKLRRSPVPSKTFSPEQPDKQLMEAMRLRESLAADLEKARQEIAKLKESHALEIQVINGSVEKTRAEAKALAERLDEARSSASKERAELERQLRESAETRTKLEHELEKARQGASTGLDKFQLEKVAQLEEELETTRAELRIVRRTTVADTAGEEELARLKGQLEAARAENRRLEDRLTEAGESVGSDEVARLKREYDERIDELLQENARLSEQARGTLATNGSSAHSATSVNGGENLDVTTIDAEVERVEKMIEEIAKLIDDPDTELSTVIRKNVERAELDAYLKGILFSVGRSQGL